MTYDNLDALQGLRPAARYVRIGAVVVDLATHAVRREDASLRLTPKSAEVLKVLLRHEGEPVGRELLIEQVWREQFPSDDVVTKAIGELRRALAQGEASIIETIPRVGYRLLPELTWLDSDDAGEASAAPPPAETPAPASASASAALRQPPRALGALLLVAALLGGGVSAWLLWPRAEGGKAPTAHEEFIGVSREQLALAMAGHLSVAVRPLAAGTMAEQLPAVSPDGHWVVYSEWPAPEGVGSRLMIRSLDAERARPLLSGGSVRSETMPVWAPDGQALVYQRIDAEGCELRWHAPLSGEQRKVADCYGGFLEWMDFTPDGTGLLLSRPRQPGEGPRLRILHLDSGQWRDIDYPRGASEIDVQGVYSPDGRWLVFRRGATPLSDLYLMPAEGGELRRLTELRTSMRGVDWMPDSRHLVFASSHGGQMGLWLLDSVDGSSHPLGAYGASFPQIARDSGALVYQQQLQPHNLVRLVLNGDTAELSPVFASARADAEPALAPDGQRLAFVSNRAGRNEILLGNLGDNSVITLTRSSIGDVGQPAWAPDGERLAYVHLRAGGSRLLLLELASRQQRELALQQTDPRNPAFASDGRSLYFDAEVDGRRQVFQSRIDGGQARQLTRDGGQRPLPSPDGRWLWLLGPGYGLQRIDLADGSLHSLRGSIGFGSQSAWTVDSDGVHALRGSSSGAEGWRLLHWPADADADSEPLSYPLKLDGAVSPSLLGLARAADGSYYTTAELNPDIDVMYVAGLQRLLPGAAR